MSMHSYQDNVRAGVTNRQTPTCLPAALEQVSPDHRYRPGIYSFYKEFTDWHATVPIKDRDEYENMIAYEEMLDKLVKPLGLTSVHEAFFSRANTVMGFVRTVRKLMAQDYRVVVETTYGGSGDYNSHTVGLVPTGHGDLVVPVSTHIPKCLQVAKHLGGITSLYRIGEHMAVPKDPRKKNWPFDGTNIMALP